MKYNRVKCNLFKLDNQRASSSGRLKSKKHLENLSQCKVLILRKNPMTIVVKEENKVSDKDTKVEIQNCFTDKILKIEYDINIDNHHDKHANSTLTNTSKINKIGIDISHINKLIEEMSHINAGLINQYKFKYQLTFLVIFN